MYAYVTKIYEQMADFYRNIEEEYGTFFGDHFDWEHFHFKFLIYYLSDIALGLIGILLFIHYRVAYRLYLEN